MPHTHESDHSATDKHHHHFHAHATQHGGGHHLLQVEGLSVAFERYDDAEATTLRERLAAPKEPMRVIDDLSISVHVGEIVAVVGASGSGKTLLADSILGIFEPNSIVRGTIWFEGEEQSASSIRALRGKRIAFIPQSVHALDPLMKVGRQVREGFDGTHAQARERQRALFARYGLSEEVEEMYPHQLSGGMARRVLLCCALMDDPALIIADEPTPGLDLDLAVIAMEDLRHLADEGVGIMLITHDIDLALQVADRIAIFKDGSIVEETSVEKFRTGDLESAFSRRLRDALPEYGFIG